MHAKTQFVNKLWRNSNSKGCTNVIFHLRTQCCVSISQLCWCQCKHIIHLPPADCTDCSQFFPSQCPETERWLPVPCCPAAWEWSAGTRTAGYYSVFRCTASYQHTGLTEAAALVNMPTPECSPWGCWEVVGWTGFDGATQNFSPKKLNTHHKISSARHADVLLKVRV